MTHRFDRGVLAALGSAILFGLGTPLAKLLLGQTSPWLLAGVLYLGSGAGLLILRALSSPPPVKLTFSESGWLSAAIALGGVFAPVLLMWGLSNMPASGASLLLNAEGVFTALIAWFVFRENFDRRIAIGMALIVSGALVLSWPDSADFGAALPALSVLAACLAWAIDNNLTRRVSLADATLIAMLKGLVAGMVNLGIALAIGTAVPSPGTLLGGAALGFMSYGLSLVLFVIALRHLGTARTGAYFSIAPFAGTTVAILLLGEPVSVPLVIAAGLMGFGVWLHLTEHHLHGHTHDIQDHTHEHVHDLHHQHAHSFPVVAGKRHTHDHHHDSVTHSHPHFPDAHHRHEH